MAEEVKLPELGESVTEGVIIDILVEVGDTIEADDPVVEISTDKIDTEVPSPSAGTVTEIRVAVDDEVEVGQVLVVLDGDGGGGSSDDADDEDDAEQEQQDGDDETEDAADDAQDAAGEAQDSDDGGGDSATYGADEGSPSGASEKSSGGDAPDDPDFDVLIVGGGTGGYSTALHAAGNLGLTVGLVEKAKVGGTCLHWGCIPTKAILQSAETAEVVHEAGEFGVSATFDAIEMTKVIEHQTSVVDAMHNGLKGQLKNRGVETIEGTATFKDAHTVEVDLNDGDTRTVTCRNLVIATGSQPRELPFAPFDGEKVISSDHALFLEEVPGRVVVLGSGAVGMEFTTAWSAFGAEVVIVELEDRLLPLEDKDVSKEMAKQFRKRDGVEARTGVKMTAVDTSGDGVVCTLETKDGEETLEADLLLVAVGRAPVAEGMGLEDVGVEIDRGFVVVDERCETSVSGVYAVGDVIPTLGLAHASFQEGMMVADILAGKDVTPIDYKGVPRVTYSHPEVGSVGYTEDEAKDAGYEVVVEKKFFQAIARAMMMKATGIVKVVAEKDDSRPGGAGRVLGIHMVGPKATDLISEGQLIYNWEALPIDVAHFIHAHPSLGEALGEVHLDLAGRALH